MSKTLSRQCFQHKGRRLGKNGGGNQAQKQKHQQHRRPNRAAGQQQRNSKLQHQQAVASNNESKPKPLLTHESMGAILHPSRKLVVVAVVLAHHSQHQQSLHVGMRVCLQLEQQPQSLIRQRGLHLQKHDPSAKHQHPRQCSQSGSHGLTSSQNNMRAIARTRCRERQ